MGGSTNTPLPHVEISGIPGTYTGLDKAIWWMQLAQCILLFAWIFVACVEYGGYYNNNYFFFTGATGFALGCWILSALMLSFELCPCTARTARENGNMGGNCCFAAKATHSDGGCNQVKCISINQLVMNIFVFLFSVAGSVFAISIGGVVVGAVIALLSVVLIALHSVKLCGCCGRRALVGDINYASTSFLCNSKTLTVCTDPPSRGGGRRTPSVPTRFGSKLPHFMLTCAHVPMTHHNDKDQYPNTFNGNATINSTAASGSSSAHQLQQGVAHRSEYEDGDDDALLN